MADVVVQQPASICGNIGRLLIPVSDGRRSRTRPLDLNLPRERHRSRPGAFYQESGTQLSFGERTCVNAHFQPNVHIIRTREKRTSPCQNQRKPTLIQSRFPGVSKSPDRFHRPRDSGLRSAVILFPPRTAFMMIASGGTVGDEYVKYPHPAAIRHQLPECPPSRHSLGLRVQSSCGARDRSGEMANT